jgi:transcriptional regulator with XRE-family HTH domain
MYAYVDIMLARTSADFGAIVREHRKRQRLSQAHLARDTGVSRQWLIDFERGKASAELGLVLRIVGAVGLELDLRVAAAPSPLLDDLLADLAGPTA